MESNPNPPARNPDPADDGALKTDTGDASRLQGTVLDVMLAMLVSAAREVFEAAGNHLLPPPHALKGVIREDLALILTLADENEIGDAATLFNEWGSTADLSWAPGEWRLAWTQLPEEAKALFCLACLIGEVEPIVDAIANEPAES